MTRTSGWLSLGTLLLFGLLLRVYAIDYKQITNDEAFSLMIAQLPAQEIPDRLIRDSHPPLHYFVLKAWCWFAGDSIHAIRLHSVVLGCITILLTYCVVCELCIMRQPAEHCLATRTGGYAPILAAALVTFSPLHISFSRSARMYALGILLSLASSWLMLVTFRRSPRRLALWGCYGLVLALFAYTHYYAAFTILAQWLFVVSWAVHKRARYGDGSRVFLGPLLAVVTFVLLYAPWTARCFEQFMQVKEGFCVVGFGTHEVKEILLFFFGGLRDGDWAGGYPSFGLAGVGVVLLGVFASRSRNGAGAFLGLSVLVPWTGGIVASLAMGSPVLADRYLLLCHVAYIACIAISIELIHGWSSRTFFAGAILAVYVLATFSESRFHTPAVRNLEQASEELAAQYRPGDMVVFDTAGQAGQVLFCLERAGCSPEYLVLTPKTKPFAHRIHSASIPESRWVDFEDLWKLHSRKVWVVGAYQVVRYQYPSTWRIAGVKTYPGAKHGSTWALVMAETKKKTGNRSPSFRCPSAAVGRRIL